MPALTNNFSWSQSRDARFRFCRRQYYYQHYGSWGGWDRKASAVTKELYIMKNLKTRPMWVGSVVHDFAHTIVTRLARGDTVVLDDEVARLRRRMLGDWETSRSGHYRQRPNKLLGLDDHYYDLPTTCADFRQDRRFAETCLRNLFESSPFAALTADPPAGLLEAEDIRSFDVSGVPVWLAIDLALQTPDHPVLIVDWKTGKSIDDERTRLQLAVYALYAAHAWSVPAGGLLSREINLREPVEIDHPVDAARLDWAKQHIADSSSQMLAALQDPDHNVARQ
ncbi:PD-(D/E)XK nuclease family protein, partial [Chloroflexota bacterium]